MATSRRLAFTLAALLAIPVFAQSQVVANPDQMSVITIVGEINTQSVGMLLSVVNSQVRMGVKKIRIVIASGGGDPSAGFSAYNYLRGLKDVEISTFNMGNVDSAAVLLFCAGQNRYSVPGARFVLHGNSLTTSGPTMMDASMLQGNFEIIKNLNQMVVQVLSSTVNKDKKTDIENAIHGQTILSAEDAVKWGLVKEIRSNFMEPGAMLVTVSAPAPSSETKPPVQFTSTTPNANNKN